MAIEWTDEMITRYTAGIDGFGDTPDYVPSPETQALVDSLKQE